MASLAPTTPAPARYRQSRVGDNPRQHRPAWRDLMLGDGPIWARLLRWSQRNAVG